MEQRPMRVCDLCGGYDDHPRHVIGLGPGEPAPPADKEVLKALAASVDFTTDEGAAALADLQDTTLQLRHMDCCREAGCPDGTCGEVTAGAEDKRGADLVRHLTKER